MGLIRGSFAPRIGACFHTVINVSCGTTTIIVRYFGGFNGLFWAVLTATTALAVATRIGFDLAGVISAPSQQRVTTVTAGIGFDIYGFEYETQVWLFFATNNNDNNIKSNNHYFNKTYEKNKHKQHYQAVAEQSALLIFELFISYLTIQLSNFFVLL